MSKYAPSNTEETELVLGMAIVAREAARLRERMFPEVDLGNPTWQILLELFIQNANGFRVSPERLPLETYLPTEIVSRTLDVLVRKKLVEIRAERIDPARCWLDLTPSGRKRMTELLLQSAADLVWPYPIEDEYPVSAAA